MHTLAHTHTHNTHMQHTVKFFEAYSEQLDLSVIAVRGTDVGRAQDFVEDVKACGAGEEKRNIASWGTVLELCMSSFQRMC